MEQLSAYIEHAYGFPYHTCILHEQASGVEVFTPLPAKLIIITVQATDFSLNIIIN